MDVFCNSYSFPSYTGGMSAPVTTSLMPEIDGAAGQEHWHRYARSGTAMVVLQDETISSTDGLYEFRPSSGNITIEACLPILMCNVLDKHHWSSSAQGFSFMIWFQEKADREEIWNVPNSLHIRIQAREKLISLKANILKIWKCYNIVNLSLMILADWKNTSVWKTTKKPPQPPFAILGLMIIHHTKKIENRNRHLIAYINKHWSSSVLVHV